MPRFFTQSGHINVDWSYKEPDFPVEGWSRKWESWMSNTALDMDKNKTVIDNEETTVNKIVPDTCSIHLLQVWKRMKF